LANVLNATVQLSSLGTAKSLNVIN